MLQLMMGFNTATLYIALGHIYADSSALANHCNCLLGCNGLMVSG